MIVGCYRKALLICCGVVNHCRECAVSDKASVAEGSGKRGMSQSIGLKHTSS